MHRFSFAAAPRPALPSGRLVARRHIDLLRVDSALCPANRRAPQAI
jgi:hypothetical protein